MTQTQCIPFPCLSFRARPGIQAIDLDSRRRGNDALNLAQETLANYASGRTTSFAGNGESGFSGDGGPATQASIDTYNVTVDSAGNIWIAAPFNDRIRKVDAKGIITTIAGNGYQGYGGDGGPAAQASLNTPRGIAADNVGNIYIADTQNHMVRMVSLFYTPLTVSTTSLSFGIVSKYYNQSLAATGGLRPYTWSITAGTLPAGLTLKGTTGVISGSPTAVGTSNFTVQVKDVKGSTNTQTLTIAVYNPLSITTKSVSNGSVDRQYTQALAATGGKTTYSWSISAGSLPAGLTLNSTTGVISGTPTTKGTFSFTVKVTDANKTEATKAFSMTVR